MTKLNKERQGARPAPVPASAGDLLGSNSEIARKLGEYYGSLISNEIPDRFAKLLDQLEGSELANQAGTAKKAEG